MTSFFDYDLKFSSKGIPLYVLRANGKKMAGLCHVYEVGDHWMRKTNWLAAWGPGGTRYEMYDTLDDALLAGIKWARRRERADQKKEKAA